MARQYFSSDGGVINETGTRQYFSSDGGVVNETDGGAATPSATISWTEANDTFSVTVNVTVSNPSATLSWTEANDVCSVSANVAGASGTLTTLAFKNNTGSVLANLTGLTVTVLNMSTFAFVKTFTGQTTNASGIMAINDALFVSGTEYAVIVRNASGNLGAEKITAS